MTCDSKKLEFHYRLNEAAKAQDYTIFAAVLNCGGFLFTIYIPR